MRIGIEITSHDGPARLGKLLVDKSSIPIPTGCYFLGERDGLRSFRIGEDPDVLLAVSPSSGVVRPRLKEAYGTYEGKILIRGTPDRKPNVGPPPRIDCVLIQADEGNEVDLTEKRFIIIGCGTGVDIGRLVSRVVEVRREVSPNAALMVSDAELWSFPLLALAGVDLFGDSHAWESSRSSIMLFETYKIRMDGLTENPCLCPCCSSGSTGKTDLLAHNRWMTRKVLSEIRTRIRINEMKQLAEERSIGHPSVYAALKKLYHEHFDYLEEHTTITPGLER